MYSLYIYIKLLSPKLDKVYSRRPLNQGTMLIVERTCVRFTVCTFLFLLPLVKHVF